MLEDSELIGIVSRADLLRGFALQPCPDANAEDRAVRERLTVEFGSHPYVTLVVRDGAVHLWGIVPAQEEAEALRLAAARVPGVASVDSHIVVDPWMHLQVDPRMHML